MFSRGRTQIFEIDGQQFKRCECGAQFPVEWMPAGGIGTRVQMTSRSLCDECRVIRNRRQAANLAGIPADAPRCADCLALVGLQYGGTVTHVDDCGRCPSCARWVAKIHRRNTDMRRGVVCAGGLRFEESRP